MNLKEIRLSRGMSQSQLAERSGVNVRMLQFYEQGVKNIDGAKIDTLVNISEALACPLFEILESSELREKVKSARVK